MMIHSSIIYSRYFLIMKKDRFHINVANLLLILVQSTAFLVQAPFQSVASPSLHMGLYDKPLPPRPPPRDDEKKPQVDPDIAEEIEITDLLFEFDEFGKEVNNRLPQLSRRLDRGIDCYFEPTDRLVTNLVEKTGCAVEDACWALEACKGDITEAWTRISTARKILLNQKLVSDDQEGDWDAFDIEEEFLRRKLARQDSQKQKGRGPFGGGGKPDEEWLPKSNPKPIDDEPWFTG